MEEEAEVLRRLPVDDKETSDKRAATYLSLLIIGGVFLVGFGGYLAIHLLGLAEVNQTLVRASNGDLSLETNTPDGWLAFADILLTLGTLAAVSAIYEIFTRRSWDQAYRQAIQIAGADLGKRISGDALKVFLADSSFIRGTLGDPQRRELVKSLLLANLDDDAEELAQSAADQFAAESRIRGFEVDFIVGKRTERLSVATVRYTPVERQNDLRIRIWAVPKNVSVDIPDERNVANYFYASESDEESTKMLQELKPTWTRVNGGSRLAPRVDESVTYSKLYTFDFVETHPQRIQEIEYCLTWPKPKMRDTIHFEPGSLCKGIDVSCDLAESGLLAHVNRSQLPKSCRTYKHPQVGPTTVIGAKTDNWILPTDSVAFTFWTDSNDAQAVSDAQD